MTAPDLATLARQEPRGLRAAAAVRWALLLVAAAAAFGPAVLPDAATRAEDSRRFTCPMHPAVVDDRASACPICGMALEALRGSAALDVPAREAIEGSRASGVPGLVAVALTSKELHRSQIRTSPARRKPKGPESTFALPVHAILEGAHGTYVFVTRDQRRFVPTPVRIDPRSTDREVTVNGLEHEDEVVTIGAMLLDAESRFRAAVAGGGDQPRP